MAFNRLPNPSIHVINFKLWTFWFKNHVLTNHTPDMFFFSLALLYPLEATSVNSCHNFNLKMFVSKTFLSLCITATFSKSSYRSKWPVKSDSYWQFKYENNVTTKIVNWLYLPNIDFDIVFVTKWHLTRNNERSPSYSQDVVQTIENVFTSTNCSRRISKCAVPWEILTAASRRIQDCSKSMRKSLLVKSIYSKTMMILTSKNIPPFTSIINFHSSYG